MQAVVFYLIYPLIYAVASLPFGALYIVSDFLYHVLRLSGYRRKVVVANLRNSFPEKSESEIQSIANNYYRYLCDLILETLKTTHMKESDFHQRCTFVHKPFMDELYNAKKSLVVVMGHYGNWEWAGPCFSLNNQFQLVVVYRPLSNPYFEKLLTQARTKYGTKITPVKNTLRDMVTNRRLITATALVADQTATKKDAYWTTFLHQDTAVFTGPEKLSKKFAYPVVYMSITRPKRGYYTITPELLFLEPGNTAENEISETFTRRLETEIQQDPTFWLWSHKRWKHKRPLHQPAQ
jgi:Kdo2-lipid IVA lauroyltransferase/acyltransferase